MQKSTFDPLTKLLKTRAVWVLGEKEKSPQETRGVV